jgi:hypothetical protein
MAALKVHNLRLGHATNSSSMHSIVMLPGLKEVLTVQGSEFPEDNDFGWEDFTAITPDQKMAYLRAMLISNLRYSLHSKYLAEVVAADMLGLPVAGGTVDHQSVFSMPQTNAISPALPLVDAEYLTDLKEFLLRDDIVILGGSDSSPGHPLAPLAVRTYEFEPSNDDYGSSHLRGRKEGDWWVIYNPRTGTRSVISFCDEPEPLGRPSSPYMVDVNITDYCAKNCPFCYRGSTPEGKHGGVAGLRELANTLASAGVFEVALGGGDPLAHPQLPRILEIFSSAGITPNLSTGAPGLLSENAPLSNAVARYCGGLGVSAHQHHTLRKDLARLESLSQEYASRNLRFPRVTVQANIVETGHGLLTNITDAGYWGSTLLLLGHKYVGRGAFFDKARAEKLEAIALELVLKQYTATGRRNLPALALDTALVATWGPALEAAGVAKYMYSTVEGETSMFIDVVKQTAGPSSFCDPKLLTTLKNYDAEEIQSVWDAMTPIDLAKG